MNAIDSYMARIQTELAEFGEYTTRLLVYPDDEQGHWSASIFPVNCHGEEGSELLTATGPTPSEALAALTQKAETSL